MSGQDSADYPQLFRTMITRSAHAALASINPKASSLEEDVRDRSLHALTLALKLSEAWPIASELMLTVLPHLRWQGDCTQWMNCLEEGITVAESQGDAVSLARLHSQLGWLCRVFSRLEQAEAHATRACQLAVQQNDTATRIDALNELMAIAGHRSDFALVQSYVDELFALVNAEDPRRALACSLLGYVAAHQAEYENSIYWFSESLRHHTAAGQPRFAAQGEQRLAWAYLYRGQYERASAHFRHALQIFELHMSLLDAADVRVDLAWCYMLVGDYEHALELCRLSEPTFVNVGDKRRLSVCYNHYGRIYGRMARHQEAERLLLRSVELARELHVPFDIANALESLGCVYREMGDLERALAIWQQAVEELVVLHAPPQRLYNMLLARIQEVRGIQGNQAPGSPVFKTD